MTTNWEKNADNLFNRTAAAEARMAKARERGLYKPEKWEPAVVVYIDEKDKPRA